MSEKEYAKQRRKGIAKAKRDTFTLSRKSWFHLGHDGLIHICNQQVGFAPSGTVTLSRAEFSRFVRFYEKGKP